MAFKSLSMSQAPDADPKKHRSVIETGKYKLFSVVVKNQDEAIQVTKDFMEKENINSILLCPGFSHQDVAEIVEAAGNKAAVCVSRCDGPSNKLSQPVLKREGFA